MRSYPVPYIPRGEEKLVGGRMSVRQFLYLLAGAGAGLLVLRSGGGLAGLLPVAAAAALAFVELPSCGMALDEFLVRFFRYEAGSKRFPYRG